MEIALQAPRAAPASWVIRERATQQVIMETYEPRKIAALNTAKYEAVPIQQYLASLNDKAATEITLEAARNAVASPTPAPSSNFNLKARVLWTFGPRRYGECLTAERVAGIIGDPERPGCSLRLEQAASILRELEQAGLVVCDPRHGTYRLTPEVLQ